MRVGSRARSQWTLPRPLQRREDVFVWRLVSGGGIVCTGTRFARTRTAFVVRANEAFYENQIKQILRSGRRFFCFAKKRLASLETNKCSLAAPTPSHTAQEQRFDATKRLCPRQSFTLRYGHDLPTRD